MYVSVWDDTQGKSRGQLCRCVLLPACGYQRSVSGREGCLCVLHRWALSLVPCARPKACGEQRTDGTSWSFLPSMWIPGLDLWLHILAKRRAGELLQLLLSISDFTSTLSKCKKRDIRVCNFWRSCVLCRFQVTEKLQIQIHLFTK